jgi:hypothetical protein
MFVLKGAVMPENRHFLASACQADGFGLVLIHFAVGGWWRGNGLGAG